MDQIENLIKDYDSSLYHHLPKFIKRRVDALKKIQLEHTKLEYEYHKALQELELKFEKLYEPLYEKRFKIISGEHQPTDDECQLPANIAEDEFNGDQENSGGETESLVPKITVEQEKELEPKYKGVPGFWLGCLASTYNFSDSLEPHDKPILRYLKDIRLSYGQSEPYWTYTLEFLFDDNPYFTNKKLTKTYFLKVKPDEKDPFSYEGYEVCKSEGSQINWNPGKDVTVKSTIVTQKNKRDGRIREKKKDVECDSFFYFFNPPKVPENEDEMNEELGAVMAVDFELGEVLRNSIIPKATLYYIGYLGDDDDDDDDDEAGDDDDSDLSEYDDSDLEDSDDESNDSLNDSKDKKKSAPKKSPKSAGK